MAASTNDKLALALAYIEEAEEELRRAHTLIRELFASCLPERTAA